MLAIGSRFAGCGADHPLEGMCRVEEQFYVFVELVEGECAGEGGELGEEMVLGEGVGG